MKSRDRLLECIKHYYEDYFCFDAVYYKWCARYDIKDTTLFILERIYTAPERCTQKYLCETLSYPKQTISASLSWRRGVSSPAGRIRRTFAAT